MSFSADMFQKNWTPRWNFVYSGLRLTEIIPKDAHILDIGCGHNLFKPYFPNLYGIDITFEQADEVIDWLDYTPHKQFDVYLALGVFHFGTQEDVDKQIKHLSDVTKTGDKIYLRLNPGNTDAEWQEQIKFFPWSKDYHLFFCEKYNFEPVAWQIDNDRFYAEWIRN